MVDEIDPRLRRVGATLVALGSSIALAAAVLLFLRVIESGSAAAAGVVAIGLIASVRIAMGVGPGTPRIGIRVGGAPWAGTRSTGST